MGLGIGLFMLGVTLLCVRTLFGFGFGILFSAFLIFMGFKLSHGINQLVLQVIGVTSCLYAVIDIVDDVLKRPGIGSDADHFAQMTCIPGVVWGVLWIGISLVVTGWCLLYAAQKRPADATEAVDR